MYAISVTQLAKRFWKLTVLTWMLVLLEGAALVAMPLVIGWAVDGLLNESLTGVIQLSALCALMLVLGAGRRFYDTRAYAKIYRTVASELVANEQQRGTSLSKISARSNLFAELVEFLETSIPGILHQFINLGGTLVIIAFIDIRVLLACLAGTAFTTVVYRFSKQRIFRLNRGANDELERQVDLLGSRRPGEISGHFSRLMDWRIKLSDLETLNFSLVWMALAGVLVATVVIVTSSGDATLGGIVASVMYVFGFIESVMVLPLYFQQLIRLQEITTRLAGSEDPATSSEETPSEDETPPTRVAAGESQ
ncbi:MAG: ABC transporter six-transmembrane domain-containing protein [Acidobacteriota bacterium]